MSDVSADCLCVSGPSDAEMMEAHSRASGKHQEIFVIRASAMATQINCILTLLFLESDFFLDGVNLAWKQDERIRRVGQYM